MNTRPTQVSPYLQKHQIESDSSNGMAWSHPADVRDRCALPLRRLLAASSAERLFSCLLLCDLTRASRLVASDC